MKIIDADRKGNLIRFYVGANSLEKWWGDDWNDAPWEHNAGVVYDRFITGYFDITFHWDLSPKMVGDGEFNSSSSKNDMWAQHVPLVTICGDDWEETKLTDIWMGDPLSVLETVHRNYGIGFWSGVDHRQLEAAA